MAPSSCWNLKFQKLIITNVFPKRQLILKIFNDKNSFKLQEDLSRYFSFFEQTLFELEVLIIHAYIIFRGYSNLFKQSMDFNL